MKTAMQELISELKRFESYDPIIQGILKRAEYKLKKEKQQIIDAYYEGDKMEGRASLDDAQQYYNETYNQQ
jgi:hypothetical protein